MVRAIIFAMVFVSQGAFGVCASLVKGQMAFDVQTCGLLSPEKTFPLTDERYQFIADLSPEDRIKFYNSYRGLVAQGLVVKSLAIRSGLSPEKGALGGQKIMVFIPPGAAACHQIKSKRINALMDEACCEGGGDAPCLLNTTYVLKNIKVLGKAGSPTGNKKNGSCQ